MVSHPGILYRLVRLAARFLTLTRTFAEVPFGNSTRMARCPSQKQSMPITNDHDLERRSEQCTRCSGSVALLVAAWRSVTGYERPLKMTDMHRAAPKGLRTLGEFLHSPSPFLTLSLQDLRTRSSRAIRTGPQDAPNAEACGVLSRTMHWCH
ncbi:hypothetical protein DFP72DRAFT_873859 [Ephemerocybe angulata]|uniref:Secreted protein n=1 Tax=Ephemerocybe angulata TaxID=980116 RepID=A0A8H6MFY0_9AGAR|nr:hypothetical protein DFP72DRAFT_873859 [Tulosesus angulatus]